MGWISDAKRNGHALEIRDAETSSGGLGQPTSLHVEQWYFTDGIMVHDNVNEIIGKFGEADLLRTAVSQFQSPLYAA